jgi:hypothetical protein
MSLDSPSNFQLTGVVTGFLILTGLAPSRRQANVPRQGAMETIEHHITEFCPLVI